MSELPKALESLEEIQQKHKREKKDLQATIQALKKTVGKGDKKKKKEISDEILRLESDLEAKHLSELSLGQTNNHIIDKEEINESLEHENQLPKVSKAQKRRDKKAAEEKARAEMISKQEEENINGPRNLELLAIKKLLSEKGLMLHLIPSNGDCLFGAIAHQMELNRNEIKSVQELRKLTAEYLRSEKDIFLPFLTNNVTGDMLSDGEFEEYCNKIEKTKCWGGQVELQALSVILKSPIQIVQSNPPYLIIQGEHLTLKPLTISYHRHMYGLGEHYNSTKPLIETSDSENNFDTS